MSTTTPRRLSRAAGSLLVLVVILAGVPVVLAAMAEARFGSPHPMAGATPPWNWSLGDLETGLSQPLTDQTVIDVVLRLALVVGWLGTAVLAASVASEAVHQLRHRGMPTPHVRGMGWAQSMARWIVAGLIVVPSFTPSPLRIAALETSDLAIARPSPHVLDVGSIESRNAPSSTPPDPPGARSGTARPTPRAVHVVQPGESVYAIAAMLADGDEQRTIAVAHDILDLNLGRVMEGGRRFTNPAYVEVGWKLQLPDGLDTAPPPVGAERESHLVRDGESLSSIARARYGDAAEWVRIWSANGHRTMRDGRVFDDPDLIVPGWHLVIPREAGSSRAEATSPAETTSDLPAGTSPGDGVPDLPDPATKKEGRPRRVGEPPARTPEASPGARDAGHPVIPPHPADEPARTRPPHTPAKETDATATAADEPASTRPPHTPANETATTATPDPGRPDDAPGPSVEDLDLQLDGTIGLERATLLSAGVVACAAAVRLRRMRGAGVRARLPEPPAEVVDLHRRLLHDPRAEREVRLAAALRAVAATVTAARDPDCADELPRLAVARLTPHGDVAVTLTAPAELTTPWIGAEREWTLPADVPVDDIAAPSRRAGDPCHALVALGLTPDGSDLFVDLEAAGILHVGGSADSAGAVLRAIATSLAVAGHAEACHIIGDESTAPDLGNANVHVADSLDSGAELATDLAGSTRQQQTTTFELRARRTGGDIWEPAVLLVDAADAAGEWPLDTPDLFAPAHGLALVTTDLPPGTDRAWTLEPATDSWILSTDVGRFEVTPIGLDRDETARLGTLMATAGRPPVEEELDRADVTEPFEEPAHDIVITLFGAAHVIDRHGNRASFTRSKSVELLNWLVTHRDRSTRTAARTALWDLDVRDATFANVVSEARRTLARLVPPPDGEWLARTLTEELLLDRRVIADSELVAARLDHARGMRNDEEAIEVLRPVLDLVADAPFVGRDYLWPDAEGITSNLVLLAVGACTELAARALRTGDIKTLFEATDRGLRVLPGHEEMIALRMRAHAQAGDTAGIRQEWASYERAILADPWSDGEPAPRLQAVRAELLGPAA